MNTRRQPTIRGNFTKIPNALMMAEGISMGAKCLFSLIAKFENCFISYDYIMKALGIKSRSTVSKYIKELNSFNMISYDAGHAFQGDSINNTYYRIDESEWIIPPTKVGLEKQCAQSKNCEPSSPDFHDNPVQEVDSNKKRTKIISKSRKGFGNEDRSFDPTGENHKDEDGYEDDSRYQEYVEPPNDTDTEEEADCMTEQKVQSDCKRHNEESPPVSVAKAALQELIRRTGVRISR